MEYRFDDRTIACTNTDRVMFRESEITKGDIIAYYNDVASVMVPHLRGRALTVERFTKGVDKGGFFQKHFQKHYPAWIDRFEMGAKTKVAYPICNDAASLVYFANQGGVAFHVGTNRKWSRNESTWGARGAEPVEHEDAPKCPDQVVFDLDPPEGRFDLAKKAAHAVRKLMTSLNLPTFIKTTGSKGLHVVVPIDGSSTYENVAELCRRASIKLCEEHTDLLTTEFYKKDRKGRLFLDTMRNALGATVVAPYSLRGKAGAPVSTPITWEELDDPKLASDGVHLRDVRARLDSLGDPWAELTTWTRIGEADATGQLGRSPKTSARSVTKALADLE
jgi:bifunctional non-homologous end joining protein LigD